MADSCPKRLAVIGAGPIGLEMALAAMQRGIEVEIFDKAATCAGNVKAYEFVRLFSPWKLNYTEAGLEALKGIGVMAPADSEGFPTGKDFFEQYLSPLAKVIGKHPLCRGFHLNTEVLSMGRGAMLKGESIGGGAMCMPSNVPLCKMQRSHTPFTLLVRDGENERAVEGFSFVTDCSGIYQSTFANWAGAGGMPAPGERPLRVSGRLWSTIPDVLGPDRIRFAGKRTLLVGTGMSAATVLRNLKELSAQVEGTQVLWVTRREQDPFTVIEGDVLPQRKELCEMGNSASRGEVPCIQHVGGAVVKAVEKAEDNALRVRLETLQGERVEVIDEFVSCCGYRPDTSLYSELQVHTCYASDGPIKLAATLIGGSGDCLQQVAAGVETLRNPEPGFFILGHKSYGRSSAFLLKIGHEQVRAVLEEIALQSGMAGGA